MDEVTQMDDMAQRWLFDPTVGKIAMVAVGFIVVAALVRLFQRTVISRHVHDVDMRYRARKLTTFVGYLLAMLFAATVFSAQFSKLTMAFGIAGAGIAFALQEVIMSAAGWVALVFGDFYKTGDRIQMAGVRGDVIDIGVFRTMVMECGEWVNGDLYNGRMVRITNSFVFKEPVYNYSDDFPFLWDEIAVPVRFGSDVVAVRDIMAKVAEEVVGDYARYARESWKGVVAKYRIEDARVEPTITMVFDENWMIFTLRYVVDFKLRRTTKDKLFTGILTRFEASAGRVSIASASMEINLTDAPELGVRFKNGGTSL